LPAWAGSADRAAQLSSEGSTLLAKADFDGALKAYAQAAKADPENEGYRQQYALVRRISKMRKGIDKERNPEKWETNARALRSFYYENEIYAEALALDRQFHARLNTAESAGMLAETELALGMNGEAAELLSGLDEQQASPHTRTLLGIALARQGKLDEARALAPECVPPDGAGPAPYFDLARLRALLGESSPALETLARSFELTLPSRLEALKTKAKTCPDFAALATGPDFAKALETPSKIKESDCSGGSSCGKCPHRAKCSKQKSKGSTKPGH
jgi:tetratricopeptide (TPR) repeat protein